MQEITTIQELIMILIEKGKLTLKELAKILEIEESHLKDAIVEKEKLSTTAQDKLFELYSFMTLNDNDDDAQEAHPVFDLLSQNLK